MVYYGRRSYRAARRGRAGARKYTRSARRRFSKKKFFKYSTKQASKIAAPVNARETFVKLPWAEVDQNLALAASSNLFFTFVGNSLAPVPSSTGSNVVLSGSRWASGATEWGAFYNQYRVLGSSIKIQILLSTATNVTVGCILLPVTMGATETGLSGSIADRITELNTFSYEQLLSMPYAKSKMIGIGNSGNNTVYFKMFRKTKNMLGIKDVRDCPAMLQRLPDPDGRNGTYNNSDYAFFYYLRIFNLTSTAAIVDVQSKMKFYANLSGRTVWTPVVTPA